MFGFAIPLFLFFECDDCVVDDVVIDFKKTLEKLIFCTRLPIMCVGPELSPSSLAATRKKINRASVNKKRLVAINIIAK